MDTHYVEGPGINGKRTCATSFHSYDCEGYDKEVRCSNFRAVKHINGRDIVIKYYHSKDGDEERVIEIDENAESYESQQQKKKRELIKA